MLVETEKTPFFYCAWFQVWPFNTVEPPNKGIYGINDFVPCREVVPTSQSNIEVETSVKQGVLSLSQRVPYKRFQNHEICNKEFLSDSFPPYIRLSVWMHTCV